MGRGNTLPKIWGIPDDLWEQTHPHIVEMVPTKFPGRKRVHRRRILNGIIFRMGSGCQWNHLRRGLEDDSTIHRSFQR